MGARASALPFPLDRLPHTQYHFLSSVSCKSLIALYPAVAFLSVAFLRVPILAIYRGIYR